MSMFPRNNKRHGFTVVELSVIMVVMGILAGLVIVSINSWRTSAARKEVQSDLNGVIAGMSAARTFSNGYPLSLPSTFTASPNVQLTYVSGDDSNYCIDGKSKIIPSVTYFIDTVRTGGQPKHGTCALGETPEGYVPFAAASNNIAMGGGGNSWCWLTNGTVYCWGSNWNGRLGIASTDAGDRHTPLAIYTAGVLNGRTITDIAVGGTSACVIASGAVYCWGNPADGMGGTAVIGYMGGSNRPESLLRYSPSHTLNGKTVTALYGDSNTYCAVADGTLYCWGDNSRGQFGIGNKTSYQEPVVAATGAGVLSGKAITELVSNYGTTCAIAGGALYCWGTNEYGQLGSGSAATESTVPVAVDTGGVLSGKTVTALTSGNGTFCAIADGAAYCWGNNVYGSLGNGNTTNSNVPVAVDTSGVLSGKTVTAIATGQHSCAIADGAVYCWGLNQYGRLGDGTTTTRYVPVAVDTSGVLSGKTATGIATTGVGTCAAAGGERFCWGMFPGSWPTTSVPVKVNLP